MHTRPTPALSMTVTAAALLLLSACAGSSNEYPSLAIRDVERAPEEAYRIDSAAPVAQRTAPTAQILDRVARLGAALSAAHGEFMRSVPAARRAVAAARGSAVGSDRWAAAQVALADLDSARSLAAVPLADLDAIYTEAAIAFVETAQIESARDEAIARITEEDRILADLRSAVRP